MYSNNNNDNKNNDICLVSFNALTYDERKIEREEDSKRALYHITVAAFLQYTQRNKIIKSKQNPSYY